MLSPLRLCTLCVVAAWVAGATADAEGANDEEGLAMSTALEGEPGAYSKQSEHEVPDFMEVSRKLVTGSWKACKDSCDSDPSCGGFKFTKAVSDHTPLCEILGDSSSLGSSQKDGTPQDMNVADKMVKRLTGDFQEKKRLKAAAHAAHMAMKRMASQVLKGQQKIQELAESEDESHSVIIQQKAAFKQEQDKVRTLYKMLRQQRLEAHLSEVSLRETNDERSLESHLHRVRVENSVRLKEAKGEVKEDEARADDANAAVTKAEDKLEQEKEGGADETSVQKDEVAVSDAKTEAVEANNAEKKAEKAEADDAKQGAKEEKESMKEIKQREDDNVQEKKDDVSSAEEQLDMDKKAKNPKSDLDTDQAKIDSAKATKTNAEIEKEEVDGDLKKAKREDESVDNEVESEEKRVEEKSEATVKAVKKVAENKEKELEEKLADEKEIVDEQKDELAKTTHELTLIKKLDNGKIETANLKRKIAEAKLKASGKDSVMAKKLDDEIKIGKQNLATTKNTGVEFEMMEKKQKSVVKMSTKSTKLILKNLDGTVLVNANDYKKLEARSKVLKAQEKEKSNDVESDLKSNNVNIAVANMKVVELQNEITFLKKKMSKMTKQFGAAIKAEEAKKAKLKERNVKAVEKARLQAEAHLAERKSTLLKLHETLNERRKKLEIDISAIKSRGKLEGEKKTKLIEDYTALLKEEKHLKDQLVIVRNVQGKQEALKSAYESRSQAVMESKGSVFIKNSQMSAAVARYASDLMALQKYLGLMRNIAGASTASSVMDTMQEMKKQKSNVVMDIAKQSSKRAHDLIDQQLASDVQDIDSVDKAKVPGMLAAMQKKKAELEAEVLDAKKNKPSLNEVVRGEFKAVSESSNPAAVNRLLARLDSQLKTVQNSTVSAKITSDLDMSRSVSRIYAHQVAHAKDHAYLQHKVGMLAKWRARLAAEVQKLKNGGGAPDLHPNEEEHYNKMLTEVAPEEPTPAPAPAPAPAPVQQQGVINTTSLDESIKAHIINTTITSDILEAPPVKEALKKDDMDGAVKHYFDIKAAKQAAKLSGKEAEPEASMMLGDAASFNMEGPTDLVDLSSL